MWINKFGGEPIWSWINDCMTLKNRHNCVEIGLEMDDPILKLNVGIFLGVMRVEDGTGKVGYEKLSKHA